MGGQKSLSQRLPRSLFRFSGVSGQRLEWLRQLLVESKLYFVPPTAFNDPLDCQVPLQFEASARQIEQYWRSRKNDHAKDFENYDDAVQGLIESMTDEGRAGMAASIVGRVAEYGMVCLAAQPTNVQLWSYYAEGHSGVAVRFNIPSGDPDPAWWPFEVDYVDQFPNVNFYSADRRQILQTVLATKARDWQHEQEWRLISPGHQGYRAIRTDLIAGVIFGLRIHPEVEKTIRDWLHNRQPPVVLERMRLRPRSFVLEVIPT